MNSKYIFTFVMTLVIGSAFILFINSGSDIEVIDTPETTTTTVPETTKTVPETTTTTSSTTTTMVEEEYEVDPPKVLITNCPTEDINVDIYELEWTAEAGSGDIVYIGILVEKDDANFTRVFFTKEDNADLITFPTAYTSNSYSYQIDNTDSNVAASYIIEINIISEQPNGDQVSTYDLCYTDYSPPTTTTSTTTTTTVQSTDTLGDEESVQIVDENEETPIAYDGEFLNFVGFEGNNQDKLDQFVLSLPQLLKDILKDKVIYVNGCHDYARSLVGRCPYGVWDSTGTNSDGSKGAEWSMSIWISNRAFDALQAEDVLIHESSHALSYLTRNCNTEDNQSYRLDAWTLFGGEEKFADALVLYFGGSYNHYRDSGELSNEESSYLENYLDVCTNP